MDKISIHQIVYCSKNRISGSPTNIEEEIHSILARSRAINMAADVSGALLFNGMAFAQVLEGALPEIEKIFERIRCDERHSDVLLLRHAEAPARIFPNWSMAYADPEEVARAVNAEAEIEAAFSHPNSSGPGIVNLLHRLVARDSSQAPARH